MQTEHDELRMARLVIYFVVIVIGVWTGLTGCTFLTEVTTRQATLPPKTFLGRTRLIVNRRTYETSFGTHLDDYTCGEQGLMWCQDYGVQLECTCVARRGL